MKLQWKEQHINYHGISQRKKEIAEDKEKKRLEADEDVEEVIDDNIRKKRKASQKARNLLSDLSSHGGLNDEHGDDSSDAKVDDEASSDENFESEVDEDEVKDLKMNRSRPSESRQKFSISREKMGKQQFCYTYKKQMDIEESNNRKFPDISPQLDDWTQVDISAIEEYVPNSKESVEFVVKQKAAKTVKQGKPRTLPRFGSVTDSVQTTLFVGGPVWGLAWCPMPLKMKSPQYLAVSCNTDMDQTNPLYKPSNKPGIIQLWEVKVRFKKSTCQSAELVLCICHENGPIRQLQWCPNSCCDLPDKDSGTTPRLGLLAATSSDGNLLIYSIPHPHTLIDEVNEEELMNQTTEHADSKSEHLDNVNVNGHKSNGLIKDSSEPSERSTPEGQRSREPAYFHVKPALTLQSPFYRGEPSACLCVSWHPNPEYPWITAGFANGVMRVWDLTTTSPLLRKSTEEGSTRLFPFKSFQAHKRAAFTCSWSPHVPHCLVTAGADKEVNIWDLRNTTCLVHYDQFSTSTGVSTAWPSNLLGLLYSIDDGYMFNHCYMKMLPYGSTLDSTRFKGVPLCHMHSTMWSVTYSDWLSLALNVDDLGTVVCLQFPTFNMETGHVSRKFMLEVYTSSVVSKTPKEKGKQKSPGNTETNEAKKKGPEKDIKSDHEYKSYQEAVEDAVLEYTDHKEATYKETKYQDQNLLTFPLVAVHRAEFNPNLAACSWVATGGSAGLVRLHNLQSMVLPDTKVVMEDKL